MSEVITEKLGDGIELMIEGIPKSIVTPDVQAQAALALVQHSIPVATRFTAGIIGEVRNATLTVGNEIYKVKFAFKAMRAITALEVYGEASQWIRYKASVGSFDPTMADDAVKYLQDDFRKQLAKWG